jgi:mRNA interferase MazF
LDLVKRGTIVTVALPGAFGKPRPAVVVQADLVPPSFRTVTLLPITSYIEAAPAFRITVEPSAANGLRKVSQIMVDKTMTHLRDKLSTVIGVLDDDTMRRVTRALAVWLAIA